MEKILTISIAAYNAEFDIRRCLDSFVNSKVFELLEIIVVNDGSKDNTLKVARQYEEQYPESIKVIDKKNGGHGKDCSVCCGKFSDVCENFLSFC